MIWWIIIASGTRRTPTERNSTVVESAEGGTYRAVHTVRLRHAVYVLHCFQKKSTCGIKTSEQDIQLIKARLKMAVEIDSKREGDK